MVVPGEGKANEKLPHKPFDGGNNGPCSRINREEGVIHYFPLCKDFNRTDFDKSELGRKNNRYTRFEGMLATDSVF